MKNYKYVAIDLQKKQFTGIFAAEDEKDLAVQLSRQNLFLVSCKAYSGRTPSAFFTTGTGKVKIAELSMFCRQFAIMINAGISIVECIATLKEQPYSKFFKDLLQLIYDDVRSGIMFSESLNKHEKVFPDFFRSMVYVGETSGKLDMVFNSLADYYDRDMDMRKKIKSALSYPVILILMTIAIVVFMMAVIIPIFKDTLKSLNVTPTGFTKIIYTTSDFLTANWLYILAALVAVGVAIFLILRTKGGKETFDKIKVHTPIIGKIITSMFCSRFARAFSLLLSSGLDMSNCLDAVAVIIDNIDLKRRFDIAADEIKHGAKLAESFEKYNILPQLMIQMLSIGERTDELVTVLQRSCSFFDDQTETTVTSATSKLQPIILCIMGLVIGGLFIAVYSPIISIMQGI